MQSFDIQILEKSLTIEPQENGTYRIMDGIEKVGVIYPEPEEDHMVWCTLDELEDDYIQQVGKLITEHNSNETPQ